MANEIIDKVQVGTVTYSVRDDSVKVKDASVSGSTLSITKKDGTTVTFTNQGTNYEASQGIEITSGTSSKYIKVKRADNSGLAVNEDNEISVDTGSGITINSSGQVVANFGSVSGTVCEGNDTRLSDSRTPKSHKHGSITNAGTIGTTANLAVVTSTGGAVATADLTTSDVTSSGTSDSFIKSVTQDSKGKITVQKAGLPSASSSTPGVVKLGASGGAATYSHNHDDRYYTETEVNSKLSGKQDKLTNGTGIDITSDNEIKVAYGYGLSSYDYELIVDTSTIATKYDLDNKADVGHTHSTAMTPSTSTPVITLVSGATYQLSAGGTSYVFKMPADTNTHLTNSLTIKGNGTEAVKFTQNADKTLNLKGSGATSVSKTADGEITISSTNTTYSAGTGLTLSGTTFSVNYGTTSTTACRGDDSRLSDSRNAKDVYSWAKASTKPSYNYGEIGAGTIYNAIIDTHPESSTSTIAYYTNDLVNLVARGGSITCTNLTTGVSSNVSATLDGTPSYSYISIAAVTDIVEINIVSPVSYSWGTHFGIGFGNAGWRAKDVKIETGNGTAWKTIYDVHNSGNPIHDIGGQSGPTSSDGSNPWNRIRITLTNFNNTIPRIAGIWTQNCGSKGLANNFLQTSGGTIYGSLESQQILPRVNNAYLLGSNTKQWYAIYGTSIYQNGTQVSNVGHKHAWSDITSGVPATYTPSAHNQAWSTITDKPSTYTPSAHNQSWSTITDKPASYTPSAHNHDSSYVSKLTPSMIGPATVELGGQTDEFLCVDNEGMGTKLHFIHASGDGNIIVTKTGTIAMLSDIAWGNISDKPSTFTPSSHNHDDRYYTETEMNTKLSGKSDTSHTHNTSIAADSGTNQLTLSSGGKYKLTTGGTSFIFTMPSDSNTHRPIQMNGTEILGNNTTALNLKAGSNVTLSNSSGTVTINATDTTYGVATTGANGLMSSTDKSKLDGIATGATKVIESTVSGWGFTKNAGTVTSVAVKMNGAVKGTITSSGTIDLGTVLTAHQDISGKMNTSDLGTTAIKVTRGASVKTDSPGYWAAMSNNSQDSTGHTVLPTTGWWHVLSMDWSNDATNWMSQLALPTQDGGNIHFRRNNASGTNINSSTWQKIPFWSDMSWDNIGSKPTFATVATSGSYNDLSNKPSIPAAANNGVLTIQKNGTNVTTFSANQSGNATANITVPTKVSELTNDTGYVTSSGVTSVAVKMNNVVKGTVTSTGTIDLGTVITSHQDISGKENTSNKVTSWSSTTTDAHYPSEKLVKTALDGKASSTHDHTLSIETDSGTNQLTLNASTKYKLTAGGKSFIFTTAPNDTYSAGTGLSLSNGAFSVTYGNAANTACQGNDSRLSNSRTPTSHASTATTYGVGTTSNYGHVKTQTGDMNGTSSTNGIAAGLGHTHSQYSTTSHNHDSTYLKLDGEYLKSASISGNTLTITKSDNGTVVITDTWRPIGTGATDAAAGNHNHDSTYLKLSGGTLTGNLNIDGGGIGIIPIENGYGTIGNSGKAIGDVYTNYISGPGVANIIAKSGIRPETNNSKYLGNPTYQWAGIYGKEIYQNGTKVSVEGHNHNGQYISVSGGTITGYLECKNDGVTIDTTYTRHTSLNLITESAPCIYLTDTKSGETPYMANIYCQDITTDLVDIELPAMPGRLQPALFKHYLTLAFTYSNTSYRAMFVILSEDKESAYSKSNVGEIVGVIKETPGIITNMSNGGFFAVGSSTDNTKLYFSTNKGGTSIITGNIAWSSISVIDNVRDMSYAYSKS